MHSHRHHHRQRYAVTCWSRACCCSRTGKNGPAKLGSLAAVSDTVLEVLAVVIASQEVRVKSELAWALGIEESFCGELGSRLCVCVQRIHDETVTNRPKRQSSS
ncbi:hypothetical protein R1flu_002602 [Riccia fluitans]|uniref:Uncharacterized protein n=1 Tax=Riccia fluitans TaxID=41844 RepID=A0ABD1Y9Y4_9MARC